MQQNNLEFDRSLYEHRDGLADIFLGLIFVMFGLSLQLEMVWLTGGIVAIMVPLWLSAKRQITLPRLERGGGEDSSARRARKSYAGVVLLFVGAFVLGLFVLGMFIFGKPAGGIIAWLRANFDLFFGLFLAVFLILLGAGLGARRFIAYALGTIALFAVAGFLGLPLWLTIVIQASLIVLAGLIVLASFLRQNQL